MASDESSPSDTRDPPAPGGPPDRRLDDIFELLADGRRRLTIYTLIEAPDGVLDVDDLVAAIARMESEGRSDTDPVDHRKRVASDLHHWHLPVLEEVGVVTYDERSGIVQYGGDPTLERWAERARTAERL